MPDTTTTLKAIAVHPAIPGLHCAPRFLNKTEQQDLLACIDRSPWNTAMSRRVQHYGFHYNYRARNVTSEDYLGPYPGWLQGLAEKLAPGGSHPCFDRPPEQIIINEYTQYQGIGRHVDAPIFGPTIATLPLIEAWSLTFRPVTNPARHTDITTYPGALYLFEDQARSVFSHEIQRTAIDPVTHTLRNRRISITFRTLKRKDQTHDHRLHRRACKGNPGPGGWGVVTSLAGMTIEIAGYVGHTTNNRMEMTAVINALTEVQATPDHDKATPITMFTDSLQIVQGMTEWIHHWKRTGWRTASGNPVKNQELREKIDRLSQDLNITWQWIKGHSGEPGNERADKLANGAILCGTPFSRTVLQHPPC